MLASFDCNMLIIITKSQNMSNIPNKGFKDYGKSLFILNNIFIGHIQTDSFEMLKIRNQQLLDSWSFGDGACLFCSNV